MINIIFGLGIWAGAYLGYLSVLGSNLGAYVIGGITIALGVRRLVLKARRRKRQRAWGQAY